MTQKKIESWGIHWFRRDLRVAGNPALEWNRQENQGRVVGLFCFDSQFLARSDFSHHRFAFFLETLRALKEELNALGSDLYVVDQLPKDAFRSLLEHFKKNSLVLPAVSFNRDYEPFARERDAQVKDLLENQWGLRVQTERDHLLIEPEEVSKVGGDLGYYQVYTPYARRWFERSRKSDVQSRLDLAKTSLDYLKKFADGELPKNLFQLRWSEIFSSGKRPFPESLDEFVEKNRRHVKIEIPRAGSVVAWQRLSQFKEHLEEYGHARDIPGVDGTSKMSLYLKNGSITTAQIIVALGLEKLPFKSESSDTRYLKELVWREFYYSILYHRPSVEKLEFRERYQGLDWDNDNELFAAWQEGRTGYPIIDAGMRQLNTEGWMHNRVRMIVASFLTKDLIIDWRWGENHFMKELLDGDLANNNGGWQWAASTGCDPQPYFRIFNPLLQSQKFDSEGTYIRRYVPELAGLNRKQIHAPERLGQAGLKKLGYPAPIVDHAQQKMRALLLYRS